jgi:hypothetical protein
VRDLATLEEDVELDLVAPAQEPLGLTLLRDHIVVIGAGPQAHDFDLAAFPFPLRVLLALALLVAILPVVHDLTDRRGSIGGHLDQVQILFSGDALGLPDRHDADLAPIAVDEPYLTGSDAFVDTQKSLLLLLLLGSSDSSFLLLIRADVAPNLRSAPLGTDAVPFPDQSFAIP